MTITAPLNALRAFEAAARTGSFTSAASELGVSSAAVSQQVKLLEDFWQETLFIRQGNRISLTDAGQAAYPELAHAMSTLGALSDRMQRREQRQKRLTLSAPLSVAETWLASRLATLDFGEAQAALSIRVEDDPIDFVTGKVDMRVFYGHDLYGDYHIETLSSDTLVAVASRSFVAAHGSDLAAIDDRFFIHTDWGRGFASSPNWTAALIGCRGVNRDLGLLVQSSSMALNLARHGLGIGLIPAMMAADDLTTGRIVQMKMDPLDLRQSYRIAFPKRLRSNPEVQQIVQALRDG